MTIELALFLSVVSVAFAIFAGITSIGRNKRKDDKSDATEMTTVIVKLENICTGITEIKSEMSYAKKDIQDNRERIIKAEESAKQAHKRMDSFEKRRLADDE